MNAAPARRVRLGVAGLGRAFTLMLPTFLRDERVVPQRESDSLEQSEDAVGLSAFEVSHPDRVLEIEGNANRDRFTMSKPVGGDRLELVGGPMAEV